MQAQTFVPIAAIGDAGRVTFELHLCIRPGARTRAPALRNVLLTRVTALQEPAMIDTLEKGCLRVRVRM